MDISQLAQCLRALVAENDEVAVPHLGVFSSELMPASFSENLSTINPPYRKLYFQKEDVSTDEAQLFVRGVAKILNITAVEAETETAWCINRLSSILEGDKVCELPGFGKMKANSSNDFFFVPEDDLDIFDDTMGLESIHLRVAPEQQAKPAGSSKPKAAEKPAPKPKAPAAAKPKKPRTKLGAGWIVLIVLLVLAVAVAALWMIYPQQASAILDRILYSKEELELLKWGNLL